MSKPKVTNSQIIRELFGSKNFKSGGVGRVDCARVLGQMDEADFITICRFAGCRVWKMGTDYVVAQSTVSFGELAA